MLRHCCTQSEDDDDDEDDGAFVAGMSASEVHHTDKRSQKEELRCVLAVIRHGDRTPKQKLKVQHLEGGGQGAGQQVHPYWVPGGARPRPRPSTAQPPWHCNGIDCRPRWLQRPCVHARPVDGGL